MTYSRYQQLKLEDFKRLSGVYHRTFTRMVTVVEEQVEQKKKKPGKPVMLQKRVEERKSFLIPVAYWANPKSWVVLQK